MNSEANPLPAGSSEPQRLRLGDVVDLVREHPAFSVPAVRTLIHRSEQNGLGPHVYRLGRKVMIDLNGFEAWVRQQQRRDSA